MPRPPGSFPPAASRVSELATRGVSRILSGMRWLRFCFGALVAASAFGPTIGRAAPLPPRSAVPQWKLPPVDGELSGEFDAKLLGGAPKLNWKLKLRTAKPRERAVEFLIEGLGLLLRGDARLDPLGEGEWHLAEAKIDLGVWFGWLAPRVAPPDVANLSVAGTVHLRGDGTWRGGELGGRANIRLENGRVDNAQRKVTLEGLAYDLAIEDLHARRTAPAQVLTWTSGHYDVVELGAGRVEFALDGDKVSIAIATISVFGGELAVRAVEFSTQRPEFSASAQMTGIDVGKLLFLLPRILQRATGRLDGFVDLTRDAKGIAIGDGYLGLREGVKAEVQFVPTPGILSAALPPAINKIYPGIAQMETAGVPLIADQLELRFMPRGDDEGRTAFIHLAGRPADATFKGPIDLTTNIRGPLNEVFNVGANSALRLMGR